MCDPGPRFSLLPRGRDLALTCCQLADAMADDASRRRPWLADEFHGAATVALCEAAARYNPADPRRAKFSTFSGGFIQHALSQVRKYWSRAKRDRCREVLTPDPPAYAASGTEPDSEPASDLFATALAALPPRTAEFVRLHYGEGLSMAAIGRRYGVGRSGVSVAIRKGLERLRWLPDVARAAPTGFVPPPPPPAPVWDTVAAFGERKSAVAWSQDPRCSVRPGTISQRLRAGMEPEAAITVRRQRSGPKPHVR